MQVARSRKARRRPRRSWQDLSVGRKFTIAAMVFVVCGALASGWLRLLYPTGLILAVVAYFKGDQFGLFFVAAVFFALTVGMGILQVLKYG